MSKLVMPFIHLIPCGCSMPCLDEAALSFEDKKSAHSGFLSPPLPNVLGSPDSASLLPPPESWRHNVIRCRTPRKQEMEGERKMSIAKFSASWDFTTSCLGIL